VISPFPSLSYIPLLFTFSSARFSIKVVVHCPKPHRLRSALSLYMPCFSLPLRFTSHRHQIHNVFISNNLIYISQPTLPKINSFLSFNHKGEPSHHHLSTNKHNIYNTNPKFSHPHSLTRHPHVIQQAARQPRAIRISSTITHPKSTLQPSLQSTKQQKPLLAAACKFILREPTYERWIFSNIVFTSFCTDLQRRNARSAEKHRSYLQQTGLDLGLVDTHLDSGTRYQAIPYRTLHHERQVSSPEDIIDLERDLILSTEVFIYSRRRKRNTASQAMATGRQRRYRRATQMLDQALARYN
jgi:hypothetical protein